MKSKPIAYETAYMMRFACSSRESKSLPPPVRVDMKSFVFVVVAALSIVLTPGCDDPSLLSVDLVDTTSGAPEVHEASVGALTSTFAPDITGNARRSLVGIVQDPLVGTVTASAGLDFASPVALSAAFAAGPVTEAQLRLVRSYRYGDTTSTVQVSVRTIDQQWTASGATSGATIPFNDVIATGEMAGSDTLLAITLPQSWIDANSALLRSTNFLNDFQGFYLEPTGGDVVVGLSSNSSVFRVVSGADTIHFVVSRNLTLVHRDDSGNAPPGTVVLQDGIGEGPEVTFDAALDSLEGTALNRVVLRVPFDTTSAGLTPNFVRPRPLLVDLAGVTQDSVVVTLAVSTRDEDALLFDSFSLTSVVQDILLGKSPFPRYVLKGHLDVAPVDNTIDVLFIANAGPGSPSPKMVFTVVKP